MTKHGWGRTARRAAFVGVLAGGLALPGTASAQNGSLAAFEVSSYALDEGISEVEARRRLALQRRLPTLDRMAQAAIGDAYGGLWFDDADGGRIKLLVRGQQGKSQPAKQNADRADRAAANAALPAGDVVVTGTPVSETELAELQTQLDSELATANIGAAITIDAEPDITTGVVRLAVPPAPSEAQSRYLEYATSTYGARIALSEKPAPLQTMACSSGAWCDPPLRGGIRLIYAGAGRCTSGFVVQSMSDAKLYLSTAGHCNLGGGTWSTHFANGSSHNIGPMHNSGTTNDFAILRINNPSGWNPRPYIRTASDASYPITGWSTSFVGMRVCKSGSFGGSSCGTVTGGEATRDGKAHTFRANYCATGGDSGGPTFASNSAHGSHIGAYGACDTIYFDAQNFSSFNVRVFT